MDDYVYGQSTDPCTAVVNVTYVYMCVLQDIWVIKSIAWECANAQKKC